MISHVIDPLFNMIPLTFVVSENQGDAKQHNKSEKQENVSAPQEKI